MPKLTGLLHELFIGRPPCGIENQYAHGLEFDMDETTGHVGRQQRLVSHLSCEPKVIILSSGYGPSSLPGKYSGIPYTTEELIMQGKVPRLIRERFTYAAKMPSDWKANALWNEMSFFGLERDFVHWAVQPFISSSPPSPHLENRIKTHEVNFGLQYMEMLLDTYQGVPIIAFGGIAEYALHQFNVSPSESFSLRDRESVLSLRESLLHFTNAPWREEIARIKHSSAHSARERRRLMLKMGWQPHPDSHSARRNAADQQRNHPRHEMLAANETVLQQQRA